MLILKYDIFKIEIENDQEYKIGSNDNSKNYDLIYQNEDSIDYQSSKHGIKIYKDNLIYKSALICAAAGATTVHENSAIIKNDDLYICCANIVFCLKLPDLTLNWTTHVDEATCFGIYLEDQQIFTHGELEVSSLDDKGRIIWSNGLNDIIVNLDSDENCFKIQDNYIELMDFDSKKYKLGFDGKFL